MAGLQCHAIKNKNRNHSINYVKKLGNERRLIYTQRLQDLDLCGNSFARYSEKCSTQIYRALHGDAMLVPRGGYSQKNLVGVCGPFPKTLTLFMIKICDFPYPIYDLTKNFIPYL